MTAGRLILPLAEPVFDQNGDLNPGATLTVYETGTTTLAALYGDTGLTQAITNPQTADAAGRFYAQASAIYADASAAYDVKLILTDGETFTYDAIQLLEAETGGGGFMPTSGGTFTGPIYGPTPASNDDSNAYATTAFVQTLVAPLATLVSPNFSGTPTAPQPTNTSPADQIATVEFAQNVAAGLAAVTGTTFSLTIGEVIVQGGYSAGPYAELGVVVDLLTAIAPFEAGTSVAVAGGASYIPDAPPGGGDTHTTRIDVVAITANTATFYCNRQQSGDPNITGFFWWVVAPKASS